MIRDERGQSLIEFALLVPVLFLLICGIVDFGRLLYADMQLHLTAQETARLAGLGRDDAAILTYAREHYDLAPDEEINVLITPGQTMRRAGSYVTVEVQAPFRTITPIIGNLLPDPIMIESDSTIRVE